MTEEAKMQLLAEAINRATEKAAQLDYVVVKRLQDAGVLSLEDVEAIAVQSAGHCGSPANAGARDHWDRIAVQMRVAIANRDRG